MARDIEADPYLALGPAFVESREATIRTFTGEYQDAMKDGITQELLGKHEPICGGKRDSID